MNQRETKLLRDVLSLDREARVRVALALLESLGVTTDDLVPATPDLDRWVAEGGATHARWLAEGLGGALLTH